MSSLKDILNKKNIIYWDTKSTKLNDLSYKLYLIDNYNLNRQLYINNDDKRSSYLNYSDFLNFSRLKNSYYKKFFDKAKILIRKDKINKIYNNINEIIKYKK